MHNIYRKIATLALITLICGSYVYAQSDKDKDIPEATIPYTTRLDLPKVLDESSGLLWWNGKLWSHNDSSGTDSIYAFHVNDPKTYEQYYAGAPNKDWEAIEMDEDFIYIGDFGNNKKIQRTDLRIFKIEKQSLLDGTPLVDTIYFSYPEQTDFTDRPKSENTDFDCEAFIITKDSIYLFTKQWLSNGTALYALPKSPGEHKAHYITTYKLNGLVTDAVYLPAKRILALCGYSSTYLRQFIYIFYDFEGTNFFDGKKYNFTLNVGLFPHQIEGIASQDGRTYEVTNERTAVSSQRLHIFDVGSYFEEYLLRPETPEMIIGPEFVCQDNMPVSYMIPPVYQASSYQWTLPPGASGTSTTNEITVYFDTVSISGNITVKGLNKYGYGGTVTLPVHVYPKPQTPSISVSHHDRNVLYSSSPVGNQWYNHEGKIPGATSRKYEINDYSDYYVIVTINGCSSEPSNKIQTGRYIYLEELPSFQIDSIYRPDTADILYKYVKEKPVKKKRRFLFRTF